MQTRRLPGPGLPLGRLLPMTFVMDSEDVRWAETGCLGFGLTRRGRESGVG